MDYFVKVNFGPDEREKQRDFLLAMNSAELIQISRQEIEDCFEEDVRMHPTEWQNNIALRSEEEKNRFVYVMDAFFPGVQYEITFDPGSEDFKEWLEKRAKET